MQREVIIRAIHLREFQPVFSEQDLINIANSTPNYGYLVKINWDITSGDEDNLNFSYTTSRYF